MNLVRPGSAAAVAVLLSISGCSLPGNIPWVPVGSRCEEAGDCGTAPYDCDTGKPGGYCTKPCNSDGECPGDSICAGTACRRRCTSNETCRAEDGYVCR